MWLKTRPWPIRRELDDAAGEGGGGPGHDPSPARLPARAPAGGGQADEPGERDRVVEDHVAHLGEEDERGRHHEQAQQEGAQGQPLEAAPRTTARAAP